MQFIALLVTVATLLITGQQAEAQRGRGTEIINGKEVPCRHQYPNRSDTGRTRYRCANSYAGVEYACAPEVVEGNVKATDRTLSTLVRSSEFAGATTFKNEVARISSMKNSSAKTTEYLKLVGIDANDSEEVMSFIGARQVSAKHLNQLERSADLSSHQANLVAQKLQSALKGGLQ